MTSYDIRGGRPLVGSVRMHGAKNAALPILAASLLAPRSLLHEVPRLTDVDTAAAILRQLGCTVLRRGSDLTVEAARLTGCEIPAAEMHRMRSSIVFLGALLGRTGRAVVALPGGCELGPRPIDLHLAALRSLGAVIEEEAGKLLCTVPGGRLTGAEISFPFPSVGATQNALIAAATARGRTVLRGGAQEPEVIDLVGYLNACGAHITVEEGGRFTVDGVEALQAVEYTVIPDRIATATYLCAVAATGGEVLVTHCCPAHLAAVLPCLQAMGCTVQAGENWVRLARTGPLRGIGRVRTAPYPGFPTDAQSPLMAAAALAGGCTVFEETIFESRFKQVAGLQRMGAQITVEGRAATVRGVPALHGAKVCGADLRGGASLCIAALAAQGGSRLTGIHHIDRGYEDLEGRLRALGAVIRRTE